MDVREFIIGENVVYGSNGVCTVEDISVQRLSPDLPSEEYYILKPVNNPSSKVFVPRANQQLCARMRAIMTKAEIDAVIASVCGCEMEWIEDRKLRSAEYRAILSRGDRRELILLIRCILLRIHTLAENKKKISSSDGDILQSAERAIREEFSFGLGIPASEVPAYIRRGLGVAEAEV